MAVHDWPGRQPVLLAHAAGLHGMVWAPLAARLQPAFRPISFDLRGHGDSDVPPDLDFDWHGFARDVVAVVEQLPSPPYGFGHSSGGAALLLAEQARPGTFAALYCYEPTIVAADPPLGRDTDSWLGQTARRRREVFDSRDEAYRHYAGKRSFGRLHPDALRAYVDHGLTDLDDGSVRLKCHPAHEALVYEMASAHDCFRRLPEVACPVRLACGGATEGFGPEAIAALADRLPQASTEVLPGLGHLGPLEDPDAVAAAFARFVAASSGDGA